MNKALKFRANNISWRNIRMHWNGTYWGTMLLLYIGPLISIISLGILYPVMTRIYYNYIADNHSMGTTSFDADLEFGACFGAFFIALLSAALAGGSILGLAAVALPSLMPSAENTEALIAYEYAYIAAAFIFQTTYMSLCRNFMVKTLRLGGSRVLIQTSAYSPCLDQSNQCYFDYGFSWFSLSLHGDP